MYQRAERRSLTVMIPEETSLRVYEVGTNVLTIGRHSSLKECILLSTRIEGATRHFTIAPSKDQRE